MNQAFQDEIIRTYSYLKSYNDCMLFLTQEDYDKLMSGPKLKHHYMEVSVNLLKEFLTNSFAYSYILRCADKEISEVSVSYIYYGDTVGMVILSRTEFVKYVDEAVKAGLITLTEEMQTRLETIRSKMTYELYKSERGDLFKMTIDGQEYEIMPSLFFKIVEMSDEEFIRICSDDSIKEIAGIPKAHLMYAALKFFDEKMVRNYLFPDSILNRLYNLNCNKYIDIQSINQHMSIDDINVPHFIVSDELRNAIFSDMPSELSKIEQAIYIYIKMCKILTYDEEFYALNQQGAETQKHRELSYISSITPSNNRVVCFEFNAIYAKLLEELGIKFTIDYKEVMEQAYGVGHESLEWRYHKFLVAADSSETFLSNDMTLAKLNQPLRGLKCINLNENTKKEFQRLVSRIYRMIALLENPEVTKVEEEESLEDLLHQYSKCTTNIKEIPLEEKIDILFNKLKASLLSGIDILAYMLQLKKVIFSEEEQEKNINIVVIRNNNNIDDTIQVRPVAVIVINPDSIENNASVNKYFIYDSDCNLSEIDINELQERFDSGTLGYIDPWKDPTISGIKM